MYNGFMQICFVAGYYRDNASIAINRDAQNWAKRKFESGARLKRLFFDACVAETYFMDILIEDE